MAPNRFPLSILMLAIAALALGLGAMRSGSEVAGRSALAALIVSVLVGLLGAIVRRGEAAWLGFTLFAGVYALLAFLPLFPGGGFNRPINPAVDLVEWLANALHPGSGPGPAAPAFNPRFESMVGSREHLSRIGTGPRMNPTLVGLLSPSELTKLRAYQDALEDYRKTATSSEVARGKALEIGHAMFALTFGCIGAAIGPALGRPGRIVPEVGSPGEGGRV